MGGKEHAQRGGEEFTPIIALHALDGNVELGLDVGEEARDNGSSVGFVVQRKRPGVVRVVIEHHEVILKTRNTTQGRGP